MTLKTIVKTNLNREEPLQTEPLESDLQRQEITELTKTVLGLSKSYEAIQQKLIEVTNAYDAVFTAKDDIIGLAREASANVKSYVMLQENVRRALEDVRTYIESTAPEKLEGYEKTIAGAIEADMKRIAGDLDERLRKFTDNLTTLEERLEATSVLKSKLIADTAEKVLNERYAGDNKPVTEGELARYVPEIVTEIVTQLRTRGVQGG